MAQAKVSPDKGFVAYRLGDYGTAFEKWCALAEQGGAKAQYSSGVLYEEGRSVPQDHAEAAFWFRKAASQGHVKSQNQLGLMHQKGQGVGRDDHQAAKWFEKAAERGYAPAQYNLGLLYAKGQGGEQNRVQAHFWLTLAANQGDADAPKVRAVLARVISAIELIESEKPTRDWRPLE